MRRVEASPGQRERLARMTYDDSCSDVVQYVWRFAEALDISRLQTAWRRTVADVPALRSRFLRDGAGQFTGKVGVLPQGTGPTADSFGQAATLEQFWGHVAAAFDLNHAPLGRLVVLSDNNETLVGFAIDHIVSDAQTARLIIQRLEENSLRSPVLSTVDSDDDFTTTQIQIAADVFPGHRTLAHWSSMGGPYPPLTAALVDRPRQPIEMQLRTFELAVDPASTPAHESGLPAAILGSVSQALVSTVARDSRTGLRVNWIGVSSRRARPSQQQMSGFVANWIGIPVDLPQSASRAEAIIAAKRGIALGIRHQSLAHAEVVRHLEPALYGKRWGPGEHVPPYGLFNFRPPDPSLALFGVQGEFISPRTTVAHGCLRVDVVPQPTAKRIVVHVQIDRTIIDADVWAATYAQLRHLQHHQSQPR